MTAGFTRLLKRWRDNYYLSQLLSYSAKPVRRVSSQVAVQIERKVRKNAVTIPLPNGKNLCIAQNSGIWLASVLFWHGLDGFEPETSKTLRFLFERSSIFVDVGANCGFYSVLAALWNPSLRVIAFEPVPVIFEGLKANVRLNQLDDRIQCENVALSMETGRAAFFLPKGEGLNIEATGTLNANSWQSRQGSPRIQVETVRFDEYETLHRMHVDLIKIDVEDFEASVLDGMSEIIVRDRPFIVCEILPRLHRNHRTLEILKRLDYQPYWITPDGYIKVNGFDFGRRHTDFLLSPVSTPDIVLDKLDVLWDLKSLMVSRCAQR